MRVLVTGSRGKVGSATVTALLAAETLDEDEAYAAARVDRERTAAPA